MICKQITNTPTLVLVLTFKALSLLSATHKTHEETFVTARSQQCRPQLLLPTCRHSSVAAKSRSRGSNEHDITNNNQITVYVNNCFCRNSASATNKRFWKGEFCTQMSLRFPTLGLSHCTLLLFERDYFLARGGICWHRLSCRPLESFLLPYIFKMWLNVVKFQFQNTPRGPAAMTGRVSIGAQAPAATELYFSHIMMRSANNRDAIRCDAMRCEWCERRGTTFIVTNSKLDILRLDFHARGASLVDRAYEWIHEVRENKRIHENTTEYMRIQLKTWEYKRIQENTKECKRIQKNIWECKRRIHSRHVSLRWRTI